MRYTANENFMSIDFNSISSELNNKKVIALLDEKSPSFLTYGPLFTGRLVGRTRDNCGSMTDTVVSLTILCHEYLTHTIPIEDIQAIIEN